ncbi:MAG: hypothetical protein V3U35_00415 [Candidatus Neomarinimicrobiota bacterium]
MDFLLLVNSDAYAGKDIRIDDSCAHCSDRITVEIAAGEIASVDPADVWVQHGGG